MYRILIADDEPLEREGMRWIISNMSAADRPIEVFEAENGRDAVQKASIYKPHIIFMDIRMPGMDGLIAVQQIQATLTQTKFVIVSAYDDFNYAQQAIRLGVYDYLIKPAKRSDITALIHRLLEHINEEQQHTKRQLARKQQLNELIPLVKSELALALIAESFLEEDLHSTADSLQLRLGKLCSIVIALPELHDARKTFEFHTRQVQEQLSSDDYSYISSTLVHEHIVWFITADFSCSAEEMLTHANELSLILLQRYKAIDPQQPVMIGIGGCYEGIQGARRSYYEAVFASTTASSQHAISQFQHLELNLTQPLLHAKAEQFMFVQQAISLIQQEREKQTFSMMDAAARYIEQNYQRELSLEEVADYVHLNPYYFSKVFKQQTEETFIDYVTRIRIEHAKRLMSSREISLKEICYMIGYNDPNYFSRVFKKVTGITPSEYRSTSTS